MSLLYRLENLSDVRSVSQLSRCLSLGLPWARVLAFGGRAGSEASGRLSRQLRSGVMSSEIDRFPISAASASSCY